MNRDIIEQADDALPRPQRSCTERGDVSHGCFLADTTRATVGVRFTARGGNSVQEGLLRKDW